VRPGSELTIETRDGLDGPFGPESGDADVLAMDLGLGHPLTGPVYVDGAQPGDVLEVEFVRYETSDFGFTAIIPGVGLLGDLFTDPFLVKWRIDGGVARSDQLPGVAIPGDPFVGNIGVAPSPALAIEAQRREQRIQAHGGEVVPPAPQAATPGSAADGLRTVPPRENGGNLDIRDLCAGSRLYLPVEMPGGLLSVGDLHFAQGDGEVCGTAIEVAGSVVVRLGLLKQPKHRARFPTFETPARHEPPRVGTTGIPVEAGMDLNAAAREALIGMLDYLADTRGFSRVQAYALASVAVDLRVSEVVNVPYPVVSALLRTDIFPATDAPVNNAEERRHATGLDR
jgi:formamidase